MVESRGDPTNRAEDGAGGAANATGFPEALPRLHDLMQRFPFAICDVSFLPLPKPELKIALEAAWNLAANDRQRASIEACFLQLSQFQSGVGDPPIDGDFPPTADPDETASLLYAWMPWAERCEIDKWNL